MMNNKRAARANKNAAGSRFPALLPGIVLLSLLLFGASCGSQSAGNNNVAAKQTPEKRVDNVEENLSSVQRAGFTFIFVLRRPDGGVWTDEDKEYFRNNSPGQANQRILTEGGKALVIGSHYKFMPEQLDALRKRFAVEDYSKIIEEESAVTTANSGNSRNSNGAK